MVSQVAVNFMLDCRSGGCDWEKEERGKGDGDGDKRAAMERMGSDWRVGEENGVESG